MRAVCQRVSRGARARRRRRSVGEIGPGLCVLLGVARGDAAATPSGSPAKIARLRIFPDDEGRFDRSVLDVGGARARRLAVHAARRHREGQPAVVHRRGAAGGGGAALRALLRDARRRSACRSSAASSARDARRARERRAGDDRPVKLLVTGGAGYLGSEVCRAGGRARLRGARDAVPRAAAARPRRAARRPRRRRGAACPHATRPGRRRPHGVRASGRRDATIVRGSAAVAAAAHRVGARLVHLSTDLVFDGEQGAPVRRGRRAAARLGLRRREARGRAPRRARRIRRPARAHVAPLRQARRPAGGARAARDDVEFYTDEIRCPTLVSELAAALLELAELERVRPAPRRGARGRLALRARPAPACRAGRRPGRGPRRAAPRRARARNVALDSSRAAGLLSTRLRGDRARRR